MRGRKKARGQEKQKQREKSFDNAPRVKERRSKRLKESVMRKATKQKNARGVQKRRKRRGKTCPSASKHSSFSSKETVCQETLTNRMKFIKGKHDRQHFDGTVSEQRIETQDL